MITKKMDRPQEGLIKVKNRRDHAQGGYLICDRAKKTMAAHGFKAKKKGTRQMKGDDRHRPSKMV